MNSTGNDLDQAIARQITAIEHQRESLEMLRENVARLHPELSTPQIFEYLKSSFDRVCAATIVSLDGLIVLLGRVKEDNRG